MFGEKQDELLDLANPFPRDAPVCIIFIANLAMPQECSCSPYFFDGNLSAEQANNKEKNPQQTYLYIETFPQFPLELHDKRNKRLPTANWRANVFSYTLRAHIFLRSYQAISNALKFT